MSYMNIKSKSTFSKYLENGLPVIVVGNSKRLSKTAIDHFMKEHEVVTRKVGGDGSCNLI